MSSWRYTVGFVHTGVRIAVTSSVNVKALIRYLQSTLNRKGGKVPLIQVEGAPLYAPDKVTHSDYKKQSYTALFVAVMTIVRRQKKGEQNE